MLVKLGPLEAIYRLKKYLTSFSQIFSGSEHPGVHMTIETGFQLELYSYVVQLKSDTSDYVGKSAFVGVRS